MMCDRHLRGHLQDRVIKEGLTNVTLLAQVDIASQREPIYRFGITPNKLMDYIMAGRTLLHSVQAVAATRSSR